MDQRSDFVAGGRIEVLGVPVDAVTMDTALARIQTMLAGNETHMILAVNPEKVMAAEQNPTLAMALDRASLLVPDGFGIAVAARMLHGLRMQRVAGADLMPRICGLAAEAGHGVFLFGGRPGVASRAAEVLHARYPGLRIAGVQHGYLASDEMESLVGEINESGAAVLFVGLGSPRQEIWLDTYRMQIRARVCQGVGGTLDVLSGNVRRAPSWVRKVKLEWLYRLLSQPGRAHRQSRLPMFVMEVLREYFTRKR